jgi:hypothetical protein
MELSPEIIEECKRNAMGLVLSEWGELTYEEVIERLENTGAEYVDDESILVWEAMENYWADFLCEQIESNYSMLVAFAKFVKEN